MKPSAYKIEFAEEPYNICLTCYERGYFKDVNQTHYYNDKPEDYTLMLSYCFSLHLNNSDDAYYICDDCICKLRLAFDFRKRIEKTLKDFKKIFNKVALFYVPDDKKPDIGSEKEIDCQLPLPNEDIKFENTVLDNIDNLTQPEILSNLELKTHLNKKLRSSKTLKVKCKSKPRKTKSISSKGVLSKKITKNKLGLFSEKLESIQFKDESSKNTEQTLHDNSVNITGESFLSNTLVQVKKEDENFKITKSDIDSNYGWNNETQNEGLDSEPIKLQKTQQISEESTIYACDDCPYTGRNKTNLSHHIQTHMKNKPFMCEECGYTCLLLSKLRFHQMVHTGSRPYACELCPFACRRPSDLTCHMRIHSDVRPYTCETCGASFRRPQHLKQHQAIHEKPDRCLICDFTSKSHHALKKHNLKHAKNHPCDVCNKVFETLVDFHTHKVTEHSDLQDKVFKHDPADRPHTCDVCKRTFKSLISLKSHAVSHSDERPFSCEECGNCFKRKGDLDNHKLIHSNSKPYACKQCSFASCRIGDLRDHLRIHLDIRPFPCNLCSMRFKKKSHVKQHLVTHSEGKPFSCKLCDFKCKRSNDLKSHVVVHSGVRLSCSVCKFSCLHLRHLKKHELKHAEEKMANTNVSINTVVSN